MLTFTGKIFNLEQIQKQVSALPHFDKSLLLNDCRGKFLNGPYELKNEFKGTPIGDVIESIENPGEARLLKLKPGETYTAHTDPDDRYHIAVFTNEYSYIIDFNSNLMHHLPSDGKLWKMDTSIPHVASNFGSRDRIHLVIRETLPSCKDNGYLLSGHGNDFDWKYEYYMETMGFFNKAIKDKHVIGFEKVNDREILINTDDIEYIRYQLVDKVKEKNLIITVTET